MSLAACMGPGRKLPARPTLLGACVHDGVLMRGLGRIGARRARCRGEAGRGCQHHPHWHMPASRPVRTEGSSESEVCVRWAIFGALRTWYFSSRNLQRSPKWPLCSHGLRFTVPKAAAVQRSLKLQCDVACGHQQSGAPQRDAQQEYP